MGVLFGGTLLLLLQCNLERERERGEKREDEGGVS
jgi:hypothetical protein